LDRDILLPVTSNHIQQTLYSHHVPISIKLFI
jgi:hypothetical protein